MSLVAAVAEQTPTPEGFLEGLWGIRPGQSRPRMRIVPTPYPYSPEVARWLTTLWGIGRPGV